jgi:predicted homoserine dehydrogenase-like protein
MKNLSRRNFIQKGIIGAVGLSVMPLLKGFKVGVNDTIRLGIIGLGQQTTYLVHGFNLIPGVKIVAGSDVYGVKRQRFEKMVRARQEEKHELVEVTYL